MDGFDKLSVEEHIKKLDIEFLNFKKIPIVKELKRPEKWELKSSESFYMFESKEEMSFVERYNDDSQESEKIILGIDLEKCWIYYQSKIPDYFPESITKQELHTPNAVLFGAGWKCEENECENESSRFKPAVLFSPTSHLETVLKFIEDQKRPVCLKAEPIYIVDSKFLVAYNTKIVNPEFLFAKVDPFR
jgi:hypothetical protein